MAAAHRRPVAPVRRQDHASRARCTHQMQATCPDILCPQHRPAAYAARAAQHDADVLRAEAATLLLTNRF